MEKKKCLIIGYGRFGKVLAQILKPDFNVFVLKSSGSQAEAVSRDGFSAIELPTEVVFKAAFLCVPISVIPATTKKLASVLNAKTLIIDTCSVKVFPIKTMQENMPDFEYIGTHPLFGPDSLSDGLKGKKIIVCESNASEQKQKFWNEYWRLRGMIVLALSAEEHDRQAAYSQGLVHFLGRILSNMPVANNEVTTRGSEDLVDIIKQTNNDTWKLFDDLQHYNPYTDQMRADFERAHSAIKQRIDELNESESS